LFCIKIWRAVITGIFEQIERKSSRNRVYDAIREAIFSGKLSPGQRLTETRLSQEFDVSRVVIREALQQLAHDGLVVQNSYKGTNVVRLLSKEVNEILSVRILLESEAVREAKKRLTEEEKTELRAMVEKLDSTRDPFLHTELDFEFHQKIWELSGNETLKRILIHLTAPFFAMAVIVRGSKGFDPYVTKAKIGKHSKFINALVDGETEEAVAAMREHIEQNRKNIGESFDQFVETKSRSKHTLS
jgi:DNA-binding GntR family transcriptional regulator